MTTPGDDAVIGEVEVARYGVRTFGIDTRHRQLLPLAPGGIAYARLRREQVWAGGTCRAVCWRNPHHVAPVDDCTCGIYAATSLQALHEQYRRPAQRIVAVIAAEGPTIIGERGMRTSAARVVAYWCAPTPAMATAREVMATECAGAVPYDDIDAMLVAHHIRMTPPPTPPVAERPATLRARLTRQLGEMGGSPYGTATRRTAGYTVLRLLLIAVAATALAQLVAAPLHEAAVTHPGPDPADQAFATLMRSLHICLTTAAASLSWLGSTLTTLWIVITPVVAARWWRAGPLVVADGVLRWAAGAALATATALIAYCMFTHTTIPTHLPVTAALATAVYVAVPTALAFTRRTPTPAGGPP